MWFCMQQKDNSEYMKSIIIETTNIEDYLQHNLVYKLHILQSYILF